MRKYAMIAVAAAALLALTGLVATLSAQEVQPEKEEQTLAAPEFMIPQLAAAAALAAPGIAYSMIKGKTRPGVRKE